MFAADWDIPSLNLAMQAERLVAPVAKWGTNRVRDRHEGTYHFYADDHKFARLWTEWWREGTSSFPATGVRVAVEPNFSTFEGMSRAEALWGVYRKRTLGRCWQAGGVRLLVDLNVEPCFRDLWLLGVPEGWRAYATRTHRGVPFADLDEQHRLAARHAGTADLLFVVFGGGQKAQVRCRQRGWEWVPEHSHVVRGIEAAYGTR